MTPNYRYARHNIIEGTGIPLGLLLPFDMTDWLSGKWKI
jgi:hypothetical protein